MIDIASGHQGLIVVEHTSNYKVDGEAGRFTFPGYHVVSPDKKELEADSSDLFPAGASREWHRTEGFIKRSVFFAGCSSSYRKSVEGINSFRRQNESGTPLRTLQDCAERDGKNLYTCLNTTSQAILNEHGFDEQEAVPLPECKLPEEVELISSEEENAVSIEEINEMEKEMPAKESDEKQRKEAIERALNETCENTGEVTTVTVDDTGTKKQKEKRKKEESEDKKSKSNNDSGEEKKKKRPGVQNSAGHIENKGRTYLLTGRSSGELLKFVAAFLLRNNLFPGSVLIFTDGQRSLQNKLSRLLNWHPKVRHMLDWYHVVKKFKEGLSTACKGREIRNKHLQKILRILWSGAVEEAILYLDKIETEDLKNQAAVEKLAGYLKRNQEKIPCYHIRKKRGLRNAGSPVENANNQVTGARQKRNGMSWSKEGSTSLTVLSGVKINKEEDNWIKEKVIKLTFSEKEQSAAA